MSVGRMLCRIGIHQWARQRNPEGGALYLRCARCGREKDTLTINDFGSNT